MTDAAAASELEQVEFTCTQADLLDALRLHQALSMKGRRFLIRIAAGAFVIAVIFMVMQGSMYAYAFAYALICVASYLCLIAVLVLVNRLVGLPRAARRQLSQHKELGGALKVGLRSPRIVVASKNGHSETPTEDFLKWAENSRSILLYRSDGLFNILPKRVVGDEFYRGLMAELARAGLPRAGFSNS